MTDICACRAIVTFGLNALSGRSHIRRTIWGGAWNSTNARDFIQYTISKGYAVDSWEFGNSQKSFHLSIFLNIILISAEPVNSFPDIFGMHAIKLQ